MGSDSYPCNIPTPNPKPSAWCHGFSQLSLQEMETKQSQLGDTKPGDAGQGDDRLLRTRDVLLGKLIGNWQKQVHAQAQPLNPKGSR